jgi:hypothetical protein
MAHLRIHEKKLISPYYLRLSLVTRHIVSKTILKDFNMAQLFFMASLCFDDFYYSIVKQVTTIPNVLIILDA